MILLSSVKKLDLKAKLDLYPSNLSLGGLNIAPSRGHAAVLLQKCPWQFTAS